MMNSLFILNKIDEQTDKKNCMRNFKEYLLENLGAIIYNNSNTIIGLDSNYLKYETLAKFHLSHFLDYYLMKYRIEIKDNRVNFVDKIEELLNRIFYFKKGDYQNLNHFCQSMSNKITSDESHRIYDITNNLIKKARD